MGVDASSYNECIKNCALESIYSDKIYGEVFNRSTPTKTAEYEISLDPSAKQTNETTIEAVLETKLSGFLRAKATKPAWVIEARVVAIFSIDEKTELSDECVELFSTRQGVLTLLPYLRAAVSSLSTDIGIGPITLPLMKLFPKLHEEPELEVLETESAGK